METRSLECQIVHAASDYKLAVEGFAPEGFGTPDSLRNELFRVLNEWEGFKSESELEEEERG